jgi:hypothetical protein
MSLNRSLRAAELLDVPRQIEAFPTMNQDAASAGLTLKTNVDYASP